MPLVDGGTDVEGQHFVRLSLSSKWQMGKAGRGGGDTERLRRAPLPSPHHLSPPHSAAQSSPVQVNELASNPLRLAFRDNRVLLQSARLPLLSVVI